MSQCFKSQLFALYQLVVVTHAGSSLFEVEISYTKTTITQYENNPIFILFEFTEQTGFMVNALAQG